MSGLAILVIVNLRGDDSRPEAPWWYRIPPLAFTTIVWAVAGIAVFTVTGSLLCALGGGLAAGFLAEFFRGMAQAHHDHRHR